MIRYNILVIINFCYCNRLLKYKSILFIWNINYTNKKPPLSLLVYLISFNLTLDWLLDDAILLRAPVDLCRWWQGVPGHHLTLGADPSSPDTPGPRCGGGGGGGHLYRGWGGEGGVIHHTLTRVLLLLDAINVNICWSSKFRDWCQRRLVVSF